MKPTDLFDNRPQVKTSKRLNMLPAHSEEKREGQVVGPGRFPSWLHRKLPKGSELWKTEQLLSDNQLPTVCEEAKCPNLMECWSKKTATFLVLGKACTRSCGFCDIDFTKQPQAPQADEPKRIAASVQALGLEHVVITMVARDDLSDGGATHLVAIIEAIRQLTPNATIELLTSDFSGNLEALDLVLNAEPEIFNHNLETVRRLTPRVRHKATYERTLQILNYAKEKRKNSYMLTKSGLMLGLGESEEEVKETLYDLKACGCDIVTMGQYLQANRQKLLVKEFIEPKKFKEYEDFGYSIGISNMYCGPFVRSSYNAGLVIKKAQGHLTINSQ